MDLSLVPVTHGALALAAGASLSFQRAKHMALSLFAFAVLDVVFIHGGATWQTETALSFVGPVAALGAVALTVGAPMTWSTVIAAPLVAVAAIGLARGAQIGAHGIAWILAVAHLYTALAGVQLLRIGARQLPRFQAAVAGLFIATSGPWIVGWSLLALGHSMRSAAALDCVFLAAIVVVSAAEWIRQWQTTCSARSQASCSGH
jgi:hypothetical protein